MVVTEAKMIKALVRDGGGGMMCMFVCVFAMFSVVVAHYAFAYV